VFGVIFSREGYHNFLGPEGEFKEEVGEGTLVMSERRTLQGIGWNNKWKQED
jgi:hypothetical protein